MKGSCPCGAVTIENARAPAVRFFCHCTICQSVYARFDEPFADITATWTWTTKITKGREALRFERHIWLPASVKRGLCGQCDAPVVGYLQVPVAGISFIPSTTWEDRGALPASSGHLNYHSRAADVDDGLPKVEGVLRSELRATAWMLPRLLRGGAPALPS
ncbi:MAG: hypothetical protein AAF447_14455 [Myxococcota bacterium]